MEVSILYWRQNVIDIAKDFALEDGYVGQKQ